MLLPRFESANAGAVRRNKNFAAVITRMEFDRDETGVESLESEDRTRLSPSNDPTAHKILPRLKARDRKRVEVVCGETRLVDMSLP